MDLVQRRDRMPLHGLVSTPNQSVSLAFANSTSIKGTARIDAFSYGFILLEVTIGASLGTLVTFRFNNLRAISSKMEGFMTTEAIVLAIDAEIEKLLRVKALLAGVDIAIKRSPGRPAGVSAKGKIGNATLAEAVEKTRKRHTMSPEGRARIVAAQKARWAKSRRPTKVHAHKATLPSIKKTAAVRNSTRNTAATKKAVRGKKAIPAKKLR